MKSSLYVLALLCVSLLPGLGCNGNGDCSGLNPNDPLYDCSGQIGGRCNSDRDCDSDAVCCDTDKCDRGTCTYECRDDRDCPGGMLCEHEMCFFACDDDRDCDIGWSCEHDRTICEHKK